MWYNACAFVVPATNTYGNFRRNVITGPGIGVMNASLGKTFDIYPDRGIKLEIRADAFNVLNHPSFAQSGSNVIGPPTSNAGSAVINGVTIGGRGMQLYGRISF
jgi:hypothetical protein